MSVFIKLHPNLLVTPGTGEKIVRVCPGYLLNASTQLAVTVL